MRGDFLDAEFCPALALDDVLGGPATQALMWATRQIPRSTQILKASGGTPRDSLPRLWELNSVAAERLVTSHILLGFRTAEEAEALGVPQEEAVTTLKAAAAYRIQLSRDFPAASPTDAARVRGDAVTSTVRQTVAAARSHAEAIADLRLVVHEFFFEPLLASDKLSYREIMERQYLPVKIGEGRGVEPGR
jgi:hypothetical protein